MDLIGTLHRSFTAVETEHYLGNGCEIWLNRADFEAGIMRTLIRGWNDD